MAVALKTNVTELPESRVRVEAEVPAAEVQKRVNRAAGELGREMKIPGFRKGKVPPPVVIRRVGREAVLDQAVRGSLGEWYMGAIDEAGIVPIGDPDLSIGDLPGEGEALSFSIEIGVRPKAKLGDYKGLEVGRREAAVPDDAIDGEIDALRERMARLETEDRPAENGDFVVVDFVGSIEGEVFEGGTARDEMIEIGSGRLIPGMEEGLTGASAGEERTLNVTFPDDYHAEQFAGKPAEFAVTVKEVKRKQLPELDDDFAVDAAGMDSIDELRDDIRQRLTEAEDGQIETEFRQAAVDAAAAEATVDLPAALVEARAGEMWEQLSRALAQQGITPEAYQQISGKSEEDIREETKPDAETGLRREAVLAAVVEAEGIEPSEEELLEALEPSAQHEQTTPKKLLERLRSNGRVESLEREVATRKAVEMIAEAAKPISVDQAKARDKLWTPEKEEKAEGGGEGLWTPGD